MLKKNLKVHCSKKWCIYKRLVLRSHRELTRYAWKKSVKNGSQPPYCHSLLFGKKYTFAQMNFIWKRNSKIKSSFSKANLLLHSEKKCFEVICLQKVKQNFQFQLFLPIGLLDLHQAFRMLQHRIFFFFVNVLVCAMVNLFSSLILHFILSLQ